MRAHRICAVIRHQIVEWSGSTSPSKRIDITPHMWISTTQDYCDVEKGRKPSQQRYHYILHVVMQYLVMHIVTEGFNHSMIGEIPKIDLQPPLCVHSDAAESSFCFQFFHFVCRKGTPKIPKLPIRRMVFESKSKCTLQRE